MRAKKKFGARHTYPKRWVPDAAYQDQQGQLRTQANIIARVLTVEDLEMATAQRMTMRELFALARTRAGAAELVCSRCSGPLIKAVAATTIETAENPKPFTATKPEESNDHEIPS